jgi:hypothetical protein
VIEVPEGETTEQLERLENHGSTFWLVSSSAILCMPLRIVAHPIVLVHVRAVAVSTKSRSIVRGVWTGLPVQRTALKMKDHVIVSQALLCATV